MNQEQLLITLEQLINSNQLHWSPTVSSKDKNLRNACSRIPKSTSELNIRNFTCSTFLRFVLQVQIEERYTVQVTCVPTISSWREILDEMKSYDMDRDDGAVPFSGRSWKYQPIPNTWRLIKCDHCDGKGKIVGAEGQTNHCRICKGTGKFETHQRRIKHIYPETKTFFTVYFPNTFTNIILIPSAGLDVLWKSPIQNHPFEDIPFDFSNLKNFTRSDVNALDIQAHFRQEITGIEHRVNSGEVKPIDSNQLTKISAYFPESLLGDALRSFRELFFRAEILKIDGVYANGFQVLVEAIPVYELGYSRKVEYTSGILFWKQIQTKDLEGKIYLQGSESLRVFSHIEKT